MAFDHPSLGVGEDGSEPPAGQHWCAQIVEIYT